MVPAVLLHIQFNDILSIHDIVSKIFEEINISLLNYKYFLPLVDVQIDLSYAERWPNYGQMFHLTVLLLTKQFQCNITYYAKMDNENFPNVKWSWSFDGQSFDNVKFQVFHFYLFTHLLLLYLSRLIKQLFLNFFGKFFLHLKFISITNL